MRKGKNYFGSLEVSKSVFRKISRLWSCLSVSPRSIIIFLSFLLCAFSSSLSSSLFKVAPPSRSLRVERIAIHFFIENALPTVKGSPPSRWMRAIFLSSESLAGYLRPDFSASSVLEILLCSLIVSRISKTCKLRMPFFINCLLSYLEGTVNGFFTESKLWYY